MYTCWCADPYCRVNGCRIANDLRKQPAPERVPLVIPPVPKGCVCPPTSEQTCQNPQCGRKPSPITSNTKLCCDHMYNSGTPFDNNKILCGATF